MTLKARTIIPIAFLALSVASCGSSDSDSDSVSDPVDNGSTDGGGGDAGTDEGGGTDTGTASFFNDQSRFSFADSLGGILSRLFSTGAGAVSSTTDDSPTGFAEKRQVLATTASSESCEGGGSIDSNETTDDGTQELTGLTVTFNNCVEGGDTTNGSISMSGTALAEDAQSGTISVTVNNFSITGSDPVAMNGQINASAAFAGDEGTISIDGTGITITDDSETLTFNNYSVTVVENDITGASSMLASLEVNSSVDGTVKVDINPALSTPSDSADYPTTGTIVMTHSDGSSLTINADTGNPETFSYIIDENGAVTTGVENWADTDIDLS